LGSFFKEEVCSLTDELGLEDRKVGPPDTEYTKRNLQRAFLHPISDKHTEICCGISCCRQIYFMSIVTNATDGANVMVENRIQCIPIL